MNKKYIQNIGDYVGIKGVKIIKVTNGGPYLNDLKNKPFLLVDVIGMKARVIRGNDLFEVNVKNIIF